MDEDVLKLLSQPSMTITAGGRVIGLGKNAAFKAAKDGSLPTFKIGGRRRVPTAKLREMLGLPPLTPTPAPQASSEPIAA